MDENEKKNDFQIRGLELHSLYAWDYQRIVKTLDFMQHQKMNTLVLHRNDFVDLIIYPGKYFGYQDKEGDQSIFDIYNQIFRKLYQYTPTRRSCPYQRRAFLKSVLKQAEFRNIQVWIENKELSFPDILLEFYPDLVKEGHICATHPFWQEFLKVKYREFFREFPEISGIITSPATGESRVSIKSNRCQCQRCKKTTKEEWYRTILNAMYQPIHEAGKTLVVRDFVFDSKSQKEIATVMEELPEDVIISLKNTPHDYYPTFPDNPRLGKVGGHRQWIEFDTMGQYFGWGVGIADLTEDYRERLKRAKENGVSGAIFRLDWESLDGHNAFFTPNKVNLYAAAKLTRDLSVHSREIYREYLAEEEWFMDSENEETVKWFEAILSKTWKITSKTVFVDGCVFSDSSTLPLSVEHGVWLAEEKNSRRDWDKSKWDSLSPIRTSVETAFQEKELAIKEISQLCAMAQSKACGLKPEKVEWLRNCLKRNQQYVRMFAVATKAILAKRYLMETKEQDQEFRTEMEAQLNTALRDIKNLEQEFRKRLNEKNKDLHVVNTLLDPDRLDCLYRNLTEKRQF